MNNCSYEWLFICSPIIYGIMYKNKFQICAIYPIPKYCILSDLMRHITPIISSTTPYNPTILSYIIHNAIIYYAPYNYISIMYISYCYHLSITYYIIKYIIAMHCIIISYINTHIKNIPVHKYRLETYFII